MAQSTFDPSLNSTVDLPLYFQEREKETEREKERERERERQRQTCRQTDNERERERETDRHCQTDRQKASTSNGIQYKIMSTSLSENRRKKLS